MQTYTLRDVESMLGISRAVVGRLVAAGFVAPARGKRGAYLFSFQDVVLLRTAHSLHAARIPAHKIVRSLKRLKEALPAEVPLSGLRITSVGSEVAVCEGDKQWHAESGQLLMDFEVRPRHGSVCFLGSRQAAAPQRSAAQWFEQGVAIEASDKEAAEAAYRRALQIEPGHVDAALNLGVLLCDVGRHAEAVEVYRAALELHADEARLHFNLGVALDDLRRPQEALASYEACIAIAPRFADAHFNAARLHDELGHATQAIRHYSEYRRLQR